MAGFKVLGVWGFRTRARGLYAPLMQSYNLGIRALGFRV